MKIVQQRLLHESLLNTAKYFPDKVAVIVQGKPFTYTELLDSSLRLANALRIRGLRRGDRVAIYLDNTWECVVSIYAVLIASGIFIIINPQTKSDKLGYILNDSDANLMLTDSSLSRNFVPVLNKSHAVRHLIYTGKELSESTKEELDPTINIETFNKIISESVSMTQVASVIALDMAGLVYTSGSTGDPKGVIHTHQSMMFALGSLIEYLRLSNEHRILCVLPLAFDYGLYQLFMTVQLGATLVLERSFTYPVQIFNRIEESSVTVFPGVPTVFSMMLAMHNRKPLHFPLVTRVTNTAAALPEEYIPKLKEIFPAALIYKMYGLTECKRVCYLEPELVSEKPNSVGKAIPGTEVFLLSEEGNPVPPGEMGILHVRGPHVMLGYWKDPEKTAYMLKDGPIPGERVLCTHDLFRMDSDGFLYFVGRTDDIIKTRGEKVSPLEVENVLYAVNGVKEAAVIGVPDEILGEAIYAYVSLDEESKPTKREIARACIENLENYMVPKEIIILPELPKTNTNKISKNELAKINTEKLDQNIA